ncbi:MAG: IS200/IS605 family transposase [Erysipelotrichaceae bacterium]|nr:IS200/IS605 family transposase [Erysipelotrichaceae bacterium]
MNNYTSRNRHKYYLNAHLIFVCKYRKQLLTGDIDKAVKSCFSEVSENSRFNIVIMESDKDHIHLLVSYSPDISITSIVRILKQKSTHQLWEVYPSFLKKHFRKEHTFWSDGYFVCSIGETNPDTIKKYFENPG